MFQWEMYAPFAVPLAILFGLLTGSFLNVVIYRVPVMLERGFNVFSKEQLKIELSEEERQPFNLITPHSRCPHCAAPVRPWQNIPVISFLLLGGKCAHCKSCISVRYPMVEMLTAVLFGTVAWQYGWSWLALGGLVLTAFLLALAFIDADTQLLPDQLTLPLVWLGLIYNFQHGLVALPQAVLGAICGYLSLWLLNYIHRLIRGMDGMGYGDLKLLAALGAWLGVQTLPIIVLVAAVVGIVAAVIMRVAKSQPIAFGPCLAISGWLVFVGYYHVNQAIAWWLHASGFTS